MRHKPDNVVTITSGANFKECRWWPSLRFSLTGNRHQYQITLVYYFERDENGNWNDNRFVSRTLQLGVVDQLVFDLKHRHFLHKDLIPGFLKDIPREYLRSGKFAIEDIQYLGWFK